MLGPIQPVAGQEAQAEDDAQQAQQIDQKTSPPVQLRQQPRQQRGDDAAHLVHGRSVSHEGRLLLREIVKGQQAGGERHQNAQADADQGPHHQHQGDLIKQPGGTAADGVEQQPAQHQRLGGKPAGEGGKAQVRDDDEQHRDTDDELDDGLTGAGKIRLDDAQSRGHGGTGHHRQQRQGEDAHGKPFAAGRGGERHEKQTPFLGKNKKCVSPVFGLTHGATQHNEFSVRILTQIFPKSQGEIPIVFRALAKKRRAAGERLSRSGTMAPSCRKARGTRGQTATPGCSSCR